MIQKILSKPHLCTNFEIMEISQTRNLELPGILVHTLGSPAVQGSLPLVSRQLPVFVTTSLTEIRPPLITEFERAWGLSILVT